MFHLIDSSAVIQVVGNEPASIFEGILGVLMVDPWNPSVDGVLNEENLGRKLKTRGYHFKRNTYLPGTVLHDHAHEEHRKEALLSGQLKFSMIGKEVRMYIICFMYLYFDCRMQI